MNYEQRKNAIFDWLYRSDTSILGSYLEPDNLSDAGLIDEVNTLVEELNTLVPAQVTIDTLPIVLQEAKSCLRRRHGARQWPTSKVLQAAMKDAVENKAQAIAGDVRSNIDLSDEAVAARRIKSGNAVGERWLYGRSADLLLEKGLVVLSDLDTYRKGYRQSLIDQYGEEKADAHIARLGGIAGPVNTDLEDFDGYRPKKFGSAA